MTWGGKECGDVTLFAVILTANVFVALITVLTASLNPTAGNRFVAAVAVGALLFALHQFETDQSSLGTLLINAFLWTLVVRQLASSKWKKQGRRMR
jgi:hypothetical protein